METAVAAESSPDCLACWQAQLWSFVVIRFGLAVAAAVAAVEVVERCKAQVAADQPSADSESVAAEVAVVVHAASATAASVEVVAVCGELVRARDAFLHSIEVAFERPQMVTTAED